MQHFIPKYLMAVAITTVFVEIGDSIWKWQHNYESNKFESGLAWLTSLTHITMQALFSLPFYFVLSLISAAVPAFVFYKIANVLTIKATAYYALSGMATAFLPSLWMLHIVTTGVFAGVAGRRAQVIFVAAHSLYGLVGGIVFWWTTRRYPSPIGGA